MSLLHDYWGLLLIIGLMIGLLFPPMLMKGGKPVKQLTPDEANQLIREQDAIVLDVRNGGEIADGRVPHALNIPLGTLEARLFELEAYRHKPIIVNCQLGGRSLSACQILKNHGFTDIYNLKGGIAAWLQSNLPVHR
ncbi:MAG: rhodanese-like domain-containing protein [Neisseriaceae bacterium]|jgi:rhodanese-related sulfurtransferase|nr:MAG: rhodanese-like domain-containing protein [Neisseriaceae bacterium]